MKILNILETTLEAEGETYFFRKGKREDIPKATECINLAYDMWLEDGFKQRDKTEDEVSKYFQKDGYILENKDHEIISVGCVSKVYPIFEDKKITLQCSHQCYSAGLNELGEKLSLQSDTSGLFFYGLAVLPKYAKKGIGEVFLRKGFDVAREMKVSFCYLETGLETWLVDWYRRFGFEVVGSERVEGIGKSTVVMVQKFEN
ncbi:MAG: GNAT family N-acetyltransferase [Bacteriovoracaceae bacterium]